MLGGTGKLLGRLLGKQNFIARGVSALHGEILHCRESFFPQCISRVAADGSKSPLKAAPRHPEPLSIPPHKAERATNASSLSARTPAAN